MLYIEGGCVPMSVMKDALQKCHLLICEFGYRDHEDLTDHLMSEFWGAGLRQEDAEAIAARALKIDYKSFLRASGWV